MKDHFTAAEISGVAGAPKTERGVQLLAERESWPRRKRSGRGGGWEYPLSCLPSDTQAALVVKHGGVAPRPDAGAPANDGGERSHLWALFERKPQKSQDIAQRRLRFIGSVEALRGQGWAKLKAVGAVAKQAGVSAGSIRNYLSAVDGLDRGDWLPALAPRWVGRTKTAGCAGEAWEYFKHDYIRQARPDAAPCYDRLKEAAAAHGWVIPSLRTMRRRIKREVLPAALTLGRYGQEALKRSFPAQRRDHSVFRAMEAVNADGHKLDVWVKFPDGEVRRPIIVPWQDIYSGMWLSWRIGKTECAELIRLSFADVVRKYGRPLHAYLDNGRGFASKWNSGGMPWRHRFKVKPDEPDGIFKLLGVEVHWTNVYSGQSKPIERGFQDVRAWISEHPLCEGAYCGTSVADKPENAGTRAVPFDKFIELVDDRMNALNLKPGRRSPVCAQRSFYETFEESRRDAPVRTATEQQMRLMLLASEAVTVRKGTAQIVLFDNGYWCEALARHEGRKVVARFDPERLHEGAHIYSLDNRFIATAPCTEAGGFATADRGRSVARKRGAYQKAAKAALKAEVSLTAEQWLARAPKSKAAVTSEPKVLALDFRPKIESPRRKDIMPRADADKAFSEFVAADRKRKGLDRA